MNKHAELIKAWADGVVIECRSAGEGQWKQLGPAGSDNQPGWFEDYEYRIKPVDITERTYQVAGTVGWIAETKDDLFAVLSALQDYLAGHDYRHGQYLLARVWRLNSPILKRIDEELK